MSGYNKYVTKCQYKATAKILGKCIDISAFKLIENKAKVFKDKGVKKFSCQWYQEYICGTQHLVLVNAIFRMLGINDNYEKFLRHLCV